MDVFKYKNKGQLLAVVLLSLFFISDALNVLVAHFSSVFTNENIGIYVRIGALVKGAVFVGMIGYIIQKYPLSDSIKLILVFAIFALVGIELNNAIQVLTWLLYISKLLFPILLYIFIKNNAIGEPVFKFFSLLIVIQSVTVILAFIFGVDLFLTYGKDRFGYSGWIISQNEATFFYLLAIIFSIKRLITHKTIFNVTVLVLVVMASLLLGTKAILILFLSLPVLLFIYRRNLLRVLFISFGGLVGVALLLYFVGYFDFFISFAGESDLLTMVTSLRNVLIVERVVPIVEAWEWYNYLLGGVDPSIGFVEMDFIDLFLFGGIIGSILYILLLSKTLFRFSKSNYLGWFLVSQYFIIGGLAGHFFASGINALYFSLTCYYLQQEESDRLTAVADS